MTGKQEGTGIPAIITIFILCMCLTLSAVDMAGAAKGYIDFKSVRIQSTAAKYNGQPNRWGIGNHGRYLAQDFNIDTGGLVSKDRIKKNTYAFCMQPNMKTIINYISEDKNQQTQFTKALNRLVVDVIESIINL